MRWYNNRGRSERLGNLFDFYLTESFVILNDELLTHKVSQIVKKIITASGCNYPKVKTRIINDASPIIASFPGYIYISTGLLDILENEDELAAMLAIKIASMNEKYQYNTFTVDLSQRKVKRILAGSLLIGGTIAGAFIGAAAAGAAAPAAMSTGSAVSQAIPQVIVSSITTAGMMPGVVIFQSVYELPERKVITFRAAPYMRHKTTHGLSQTSCVFALYNEIYQGYESEKELKSIESAVRDLIKAGYSPKAILSVFHKLSHLKDKYLSKGYLSNLLSPQPSLETKIEHAKKIIEQSP